MITFARDRRADQSINWKNCPRRFSLFSGRFARMNQKKKNSPPPTLLMHPINRYYTWYIIPGMYMIQNSIQWCTSWVGKRISLIRYNTILRLLVWCTCSLWIGTHINEHDMYNTAACLFLCANRTKKREVTQDPITAAAAAWSQT